MWSLKTQIGIPLYVIVIGGVGLTAVAVAALALLTQNLRLRKRAEVDYLTGLFNRTLLDTLLVQEVYRRERSDSPLSIAMFDIDHFKDINDRFGHQRGDGVLKELASIFIASSRRADTIGRWGGEEFLMILPYTDLDQALSACERIRERVERRKFRGVGRVAVSAGVAEAMPDETAEELLARADAALYRAKNGGRNRCEADRPLVSLPEAG